MSNVLQFPSYKMIERYLINHPATQDPVFKNKKIIALTGVRFADKEKLQFNVQMCVLDIIYDPDIKLKVNDDEETNIIFNLTKALIDCAVATRVKHLNKVRRLIIGQ